MAKIIAPNKQYTGISAGVSFIHGEGDTDDPHLIEWFESKGYTVEKSEPKNPAKKPELKKKAEK